MPGSNTAVLFLSKYGALNINKAGGGKEEIVLEPHIFFKLRFVCISLNLYFLF